MNIPVSPSPQLVETPVVAVDVALPERKFSERGIIAVTALGHFLCHLSENVYPGVMLAVMADFTLSKTVAPSLAVLGYSLLGIGALPVGIMSDRWGPKRMFHIYFLLMAVAGVLVAVSPDVWFLCASLTLLGLAASIYHPVGLAMLSLGVKARGRAMGINGVAGNVGIALGPALGAAFCLGGWWRLAYVIVAVLSLISFVVFWWLARGISSAVETAPQSPPPASSDTNEESPPAPVDIRRSSWLWRSLPLLLLYAAMVCGGFNYRYLMTALPNYISGEQTAKTDGASTRVQSDKLPVNQKTVAVGSLQVDYTRAFKIFLVLMVGGIGQLAGGWLSDRFGARYVYPTLILIVVPLAVVVGFSGGSMWLILPACLLAACMFGQQPVENSVLAEKTSRGRRGLSYAAKFTLTFGVGALGASIAGLVWQYASLGTVFFLIAGSALVMAILAVLALNLRAKKTETGFRNY